MEDKFLKFIPDQSRKDFESTGGCDCNMCGGVAFYYDHAGFRFCGDCAPFPCFYQAAEKNRA